ncbi:MAG: TIGR03032 family protein [Planctomycetes bacterium]|nr:TIGR03032 family protein [Planctomycetota bacterium]
MAANTPQLEITCSRQFPEWLAEQRVSLAFTTYQTGKLFMIGLQPDGRLSIFERTFNRCMGLYGDGQTLWMSTLYQLWRLENVVVSGQVVHGGYDRLFVPQLAYTTGDVDIHDIVATEGGQVAFANTLFNCVATLSETHSFKPLWQPRFISKLAAEDRCHLNGLALENGEPRYVTTVSQSDIVDGWRERRHDGGCVIDIESNEPVTTGLSMPHSPRVYRDQLWVLNSGTGHFGRVDRVTATFEPLTFCAGYLRGMGFNEDFAIVGLSRPRDNKTFTGLELDDNLVKRDAEARCGLQVIDLRSMDVVHWLRIEGIVAELYDVVVLPNVVRPMLLGLKSDEIRRTLSIDESSSR